MYGKSSHYGAAGWWVLVGVVVVVTMSYCEGMGQGRLLEVG